MKRKSILLIAILTLCQLGMAQRNTFTGDLTILNFDEFQAFANEKYTHIEGNLTIRQSIFNSGNDGHIFDEIPDGLNSLIEVSGDFRVVLEFNESTFQPKNLVRVGGNLDINNLRYIKLNKLREVGGDFIPNDIVFLKELSVPRLELIGGNLDWGFAALPEIRFPRLKFIGGNLDLQNDQKTTLIHMPRLTRVAGNVDIDGVTIPSNETLKVLNMQQLKSVGGFMTLELPFSEIDRPTLNSLETVGGDFLLRGTIPNLPRLEEVLGKFDINSSGISSNVDLSFPSLRTVTGDLIFKGLNNNPDALRSFSANKLEQVGGDIKHDTFLTDGAPIKEFKAPSLRQATSVSVTASSFDLSALEQISWMNIMKIATNGTADFPSLKSGQINLSAEDGNPLGVINFPALEHSTVIATNGLELHYPNLTGGIDGLSLDNKINSADFSSLVNLESITIFKSEVAGLDLASLKKVGDFTFEEASSFSAELPALEEIDNLRVNNSTLNNFSLNASKINGVSIIASTINDNLLAALENVQDFSLTNSHVTNTLNLSGVTFANSVRIVFATPAGVDLNNLTSAAIFNSDQNGLDFTNVTDVNLASLIQINELSFGNSTSPENAVLKSVTLSSLARINSLEIASDALESVSLSQLQTIGTFTLRSASLRAIAINSLVTAKKVDISGEDITTIGLSGLKRIETLGIFNTDISNMNLGGVKEAQTMSFSNLPSLTKIDLGELPQMKKLILTDLPKLETLTTTKPGEEGGLIAELDVSNVMEETIEQTCDNGATLTRTFNPALRLITLKCEPFEVNEEISSRPVVDEDIKYVTDSPGTGFTFEDDIDFPVISVSSNVLDFELLAESETSKELKLTIANNGQADAGISIKILGDVNNVYSISSSSFSLNPGGSREITVTFAPTQIGQENAELEISSENNSNTNVQITGIKDGCIQIGEMCIKALSVSSEGEGKFRLSNQVILADFLNFTGEVLVDTNEGSIEGNGLVFVDNIPSLGNVLLSGKVELYQGEFEFNLLEAGSKKLASSLEDGTNNLLRFANLPIQMNNLEFIENGLQFSAKMKLPPVLKGTEVNLESVKITSTEGVELEGQVNVPGSIRLGGAASVKDMFFSFNTGENEFAGGATIETRLFDISADVVVKQGALDEVGVTIVPAKPIPVGPTGWSLTEGTGRLISLQSPPPTLSLSVDMQPSVIASFDLVKLNDLGLSYTFGRELEGSGELVVLDQTVASARLKTRDRSIEFQGEVNFDDFIIGKAFMSIDNTSNGINLRGQMNAKIQIPDRDSFFYQVFDGAVGLPYTVASAETFLYNTRFSGETNVLGFSVAYGLAYVDDEFHFDLAESHHLLNQELFGNQAGAPNFTNTLTSRFEGKSVKYKPNNSVSNNGNTQNSQAPEQTEQSFTISRELHDIFIRVQHETVKPQYSIIMPDGNEINAENAKANGALFVESETETKQAFYAFKNPAMGEWRIMISSDDVEYSIDVAGADPEPSLSFGTLERDGQTITIPWTLDNVNEDYSINLLFDNDNEHFNGSEIVANLTFNAESHEWNIEGLGTGEYYVYAELQNTETGVIKGFYADQAIQIIEAGAPEAPTGIMASNDDIEVQVSWEAVAEATEYTLYYDIGKAPGFESPSFQADATSLTLSELIPGKNYFFAVAAWNDQGVQGPLSDHTSLEFISESQNNAPVLEQVEDKTIIATLEYSQELAATDQENDELSFLLISSPDGMTLSEKTINWTPTIEQLGLHNVAVEVTDAFGNLAEMEFSLLVERPNNPPTDISLSSSTLVENNEAGAVVGILTATDEDADDVHTFELISGDGSDDNESFEISGSELKAKTSFDFEVKTSASVRVKTIDKVGQSFEKSFEINIENQNEAPTSIALSDQSIDENQAVNTVVATLSTEDPDDGDSHTYSLVSGEGDADNAAFSVSDNNLLSSEVFDFETRDTYQIRLSVTDADNLSFEKAFTISIEDGPDPQIRVVETSLTFDATALGLTDSQTFTIHNDGEANLDVSQINSPEGFSVSVSTVQVAAGASSEVTVTFSPTEERQYSGDIEIVSNAGTVMVAVSGEGAIITSIDDEVFDKSDVNVFPNPSHDLITIDLSKLNGLPSAIDIFKPTGQPVIQLPEASRDSAQVDVKRWQPGIYLLKISTERGFITKPIIVKQ